MMLRRLIRFVLVAGVLALLVLTVLHREHYRSMLAEGATETETETETAAADAATATDLDADADSEATTTASTSVDSLQHFAD